MRLSVLLSALFFSLTVFAQDRDTILIDFGSTSNLSSAPWNNLTLPRTGSLDQLFRTDGFASGYSLAVSDAWNGVNQTGTTTPAAELGFPSSATGDSFFGNDVLFSDRIEETGGVTIAGLTVGKAYLVEVFASRIATDNRQTRYVIAGQDSVVVFVDVSDNTDMLGVATVVPDANGEISITTSSGPENNNSNGFHYLGALRLSYPAEDSPVPASIAWIQPMPLEVTWYDELSAVLRWEAVGVPAVVLSYSVDGGANFTAIDTLGAGRVKYEWLIPPVESETDVILRLSGGGLEATTDFVLRPDDFSCTTVVIGSSTAAGSGASVYDSSWVGRFVLNQEVQNWHVISNLARGGYDTYRLLPTAYEVPGGAPSAPDTLRNVDAALALNPSTIIINLPSNDAARGYTVEEQMRNFTVMRDTIAARSPDTRLIIATPQPRNFDSTRVAIQLGLLEAVLASDFDVVDFWSGLATDDGVLDPTYDSGDGVHLNDVGHRLLFDRIIGVGAEINNCSSLVNVVDETPDAAYKFAVYPNPIEDFFTIELPDDQPVDLTISTVDGRVIYQVSEVIHGQRIATRDMPADLRQAIISVQSRSGGVASKVVYLR